MSFSGSALLPSQDALLHRLLHLSLYGEQLMVLTGEDGAGKTTLATALLNELEHHSSALVICPKHCDSAEIRRKILVQLLSDPVFDDEIPLPECLLSVVDSLPAESCIVLDDAHLLPLDIWAECIVLSQIYLSGKSIKILMTSPIEFYNDVADQLPEPLLEQVLPIHIEPLEQTEREGLYYTLLSRSEQQPFTPRDIVKNRLEMQLGTPKEVVGLLELALNGEQVQLPQKSRLKMIIIVSTLCLIALLASWLLIDSHEVPDDVKAKKVEFAINLSQRGGLDNRFLIEYAERVLKHYSPTSSFVISNSDQLEPSGDIAAAVTTYKAKQITTFTAEQQEPVNATAPQSSDKPNEVPPKVIDNRVEAASMVEQDNLVTKSARASRPIAGYTLQLVSVKKLDSLRNTLLRLEDIPQVKVARYKKRWVVLLGEFSSRKIAQEQSALLMAKTGISEPWIRSWHNLNEYELQDVLPTREIQ
ncbi:Sporulation domain protein [Shewanella halifaxensis HAW-EB4]|uniref:Sporulation domain protein n=1 Tax=Shewanella halifaxensis (strain HAW-EB4) TaxID=458817 RepID=B0TL75_SHEHH|nr:AAA family ATPase [Shewanella halifaxensis]ABZ78620.1 Sporulation domain protein [Shewanella halifaxensis HAW-EB4]